MDKENDKCAHCGKDTGQIDKAKREVYCNDEECKKAFYKKIMLMNGA